jgi:hypothetical protein
MNLNPFNKEQESNGLVPFNNGALIEFGADPVGEANSFLEDVTVFGGTVLESGIDSLSFGLFKPDIIDEAQEKRNPIASTGGKILGGAAGFIGSLSMTGGLLKSIPVTSKLMGATYNLARSTEKGARLFGGAAEVGGMGVARDMIAEFIDIAKTKDINIVERAKNVAENGIMFAAFGGLGALARYQPLTVQALISGAAAGTVSAGFSMMGDNPIDKKQIATEMLTAAAFEFLHLREVKPGVKGDVVKGLYNLVQNTKLKTPKDIRAEIKRLYPEFGEFEEGLVNTVVGIKAFSAEEKFISKSNYKKKTLFELEQKGATPEELAILKKDQPYWTKSYKEFLNDSEGLVSKSKSLFMSKRLSGMETALYKELEGVINMYGLKSADFGTRKKGTVVQEGNKYNALDDNGKVIGTYDTFMKAQTKAHKVKGEKTETNQLTETMGNFIKWVASKEGVSIKEGDDTFKLLTNKEFLYHVYSGIKESKRQLLVTYKNAGLDAKVPGPLERVTSFLEYIHVMDIANILQPIIRNNMNMDVEKREWLTLLGGLEKEWAKRHGVTPWMEAKAAIKNQDLQTYKQLMKDLQTKGFDPDKAYSSQWDRDVYKLLKEIHSVGLERTNQYLRLWGEKEIENLPDYMRRVYRLRPKNVEEAVSKQRQKGEPWQVPKDERMGYRSPRVDKGIPKSYKTGTFKERSVSDAEWDQLDDAYKVLNPFALTRDYIANDLKTLYLEQPAKMVSFRLNKMKGEMDSATFDWIDKTVNRVFYGDKSFDKQLSSWMERGPIGDVIKKVSHKLLNREFSSVPMADISSFYGQMMNRAAISFRVDMGIRNTFQVVNDLSMAMFSSVYKTMGDTPKWVDDLVKEQYFYKRAIHGIEGIGDQEALIDKIGGYPMQRTHKGLVTNSIKMAIYDADELIMNPKYWKHGWASKERMAGKRPENGERYFPSEKKLVELEANHRPLSNQYDYTQPGFSPLHQTSTGRLLLKFWTWPINYSTSTWREMTSRALFAKPGWSSKGMPQVTIPTSMRIAPLKHLAYNMAIINAGALAGFDLTSVGWSYRHITEGVKDFNEEEGLAKLGAFGSALSTGPMPDRFPPVLDAFSSLYTFLTSNDPYDRKVAERKVLRHLNPGTYLPGSAATRNLLKGRENESLRDALFGSGINKEPFTDNKRRKKVINSNPFSGSY